MADNVSRATRSRIMGAVPQKNSKQELAVRQLLHRLGFRFRLHKRDLPGSPDIVLPKYQAAILVQGCFWHQHEGCRKARRPASNREYWDRKLDENIERDRRDLARLEALGWRPFIVWQCELADQESFADSLLEFLLESPTPDDIDFEE